MITKNSIVDDINQKLKIHGKNIYDEPMFRVVFSEDQTETRKVLVTSKFGKYGDIKEVKKYPWIHKKWIIERWAPGHLAHHPDLVTVRDGIYFCIYVFQDANQNYLPPLLKVAEIIVKAALNPRKKAEAIAQDEAIDQIQEEVEVSKIELDLAIESDRKATKDPKSKKESISEGFVQEKI